MYIYIRIYRYIGIYIYIETICCQGCSSEAFWVKQDFFKSQDYWCANPWAISAIAGPTPSLPNIVTLADRKFTWRHHLAPTKPGIIKNFIIYSEFSSEKWWCSILFSWKMVIFHSYVTSLYMQWLCPDLNHQTLLSQIVLPGAKRREWIGMGLLDDVGWLLLVIMDHSRKFPA